MTQHRLQHLPRVSLERMARARGIAGTSRLTREQLIEALGARGGVAMEPFVAAPVVSDASHTAPPAAATPDRVTEAPAVDVAQPAAAAPDAPSIISAEPAAAAPDQPSVVAAPQEPSVVAAPARPSTPPTDAGTWGARQLLLPALVGAAAAGVLGYLLDPFGRH